MTPVEIIHILASLFTILFAVYTIYYVFHRHSLQHRIYKMTARIKPLVIGRNSKKHIVEILTLDGFPRNEVEELYEIILAEVESRKNSEN